MRHLQLRVSPVQRSRRRSRWALMTAEEVSRRTSLLPSLFDMPRAIHVERHYTQRIGWLRAAVLGANDGIVSTAALVVGVAAAESGRSSVLIAGLAGLVAGAMSMAAGEYVSVSS